MSTQAVDESCSARSTPSLSLFHSPSTGKLYRESWTGSETPYSFHGSRLTTLNDKYSLSPDPRTWGANLSLDFIESDDALHNPGCAMEDSKETRDLSFSRRGLANIGCLLALCSGFLMLFIGYPVLSYARHRDYFDSPYDMGRPNLTGHVPSLGNFGLIDLDTPNDAYYKRSYKDGSMWQLVFSDEFNTEGRSFYPGDDPYWEAVDLHYWATNNLEWYDPEAVTTANGSLVITFSEKETHDLHYQGGLVASWNKFCFTGGLVEVSVQLPGTHNVVGMWPAIWTMGNLGRAGYGASLDGTWPYTYDSCDVGTAPHQIRDSLPLPATMDGDPSYGYSLSYLAGQKLSRCTCPGEDHPGPIHQSDGTFVGRSAPEIDIFEAQVTGNPLVGQVSQSAQWAPFNHAWMWQNTSENMIIADPSISKQNSFIGSAMQQATSVVTTTDQACYEFNAGCYSVYGFEYKPGYDNAYIHWVANSKDTWTLNVAGVGPDSSVEIAARGVSQEPMYLIMNLGMSKNFGAIDFQHLTFPVHMHVDYVRVYQPSHAINIGCNPKDFPTTDYIGRHIEAYMNPNLTTWTTDYGQPFPKNSFLKPC